MLARMEHHQVPLYLAAMVLGAGLGLGFPVMAAGVEPLITPALAVLLWSTFLAIPLTRLSEGLRDRRFLLFLLVLNFVVVPAVAWLLTRPLVAHPELVLGILLVLLAPCIDWVIVFAGLAGGDRARLTAAAPLLMLAQMVLLAPLLWLLAGRDLGVTVTPGPFVNALVWMVLVPLAAAIAVQAAARRAGAGPRTAGPAEADPAATGAAPGEPVPALRRAAEPAGPGRVPMFGSTGHPGLSGAARRLEAFGQALMVPALMLVLVVVVGSQIAAVEGRLGQLAPALPVYVGFLVIMTGLTVLIVRAARLPVASARAAVFAATARNSLVVLPLAVAVSGQAPLIPLAVIAQTMVELVGMVLLVRLVPRLLPDRD